MHSQSYQINEPSCSQDFYFGKLCQDQSQYIERGIIKQEFHKGKRIVKDPIHGFIELPSMIWEFIDTEDFQRLRFIKQLVAENFVYNGVSFSVFDTSLGSAFLGYKYMKKIAKSFKQEDFKKVGFANREQYSRATILVTIACLCSQLGILPYHTILKDVIQQNNDEYNEKEKSGAIFQEIMKQISPTLKAKDQKEQREAIKNLKHDRFKQLIKESNYCCSQFDQECKIFQFVCEQENELPHGIDYDRDIFELTNEETMVIKDMIVGISDNYWGKNYSHKKVYPNWIFKLANNSDEESFDVPKLERIMRIAGASLENKIQYQYIFKNTYIQKIEQNFNKQRQNQQQQYQIKFDIKLTQIDELKQIQMILNKRVHEHTVVQGVALLLKKVFEKSYYHLNIIERINDLNSFKIFNDHIIQEILDYKKENDFYKSQNNNYLQLARDFPEHPLSKEILRNESLRNKRESDLKESEQLLKKLLNRKLYKTPYQCIFIRGQYKDEEKNNSKNIEQIIQEIQQKLQNSKDIENKSNYSIQIKEHSNLKCILKRIELDQIDEAKQDYHQEMVINQKSLLVRLYEHSQISQSQQNLQLQQEQILQEKKTIINIIKKCLGNSQWKEHQVYNRPSIEKKIMPGSYSEYEEEEKEIKIFLKKQKSEFKQINSDLFDSQNSSS